MELAGSRRRRAVRIGGGLVLRRRPARRGLRGPGIRQGHDDAGRAAGRRRHRRRAGPCIAAIRGEPHEHHPSGPAAARNPSQARVSRHFPATIGRFDAPADRAVIDGLVRWVEARYAEDLAKRPSKHVYVSTLPASVVAEIDRLRDSPIIRDLIAREVPAGSTIAPMKHTDELYLSHYNKDRGGDQGLFDKHYDGNLRFLASSIVVRALIYLQSDDTYKVVFARQPRREGLHHLRVRPARLPSRAALGRGHVQSGRPAAHPAEVQLSCNAARRRHVRSGRTRRQHRRVLRREGGDGILQEPAHAGAGRRRVSCATCSAG